MCLSVICAYLPHKPFHLHLHPPSAPLPLPSTLALISFLSVVDTCYLLVQMKPFESRS